MAQRILTFLVMFTLWISLNITLVANVSMGGVLTTLGFSLLAVSISFPLRGKVLSIYLVSIVLISTIFVITEVLYFRYFGTPMTMYTFLQASNLSGLGGSISHLVAWKDFWYLMGFLLLAAGIFLLPSSSYKKRWMILGLGIACLFVLAKPVKTWLEGGDVLKKFNATTYVEYYGVLGHHGLDLLNYVKNSKTITLTEAESSEVNNWFQTASYSTTRETPLASFGEMKGKNLLLIQWESLQQFVVGKTIEGKKITPNLNQLMKNSISFSSFYPQTREGNSSDGELLTNASIYPLKEGSTFFRYPSRTYPSLASMLKENNYATQAFHGDEGHYWNRDKVYPNLGFDHYFAIDEFDDGQMIGMGLSDRSFYQQSIEKLTQTPSPFYGFLISLTSHTPYEISADLKTLTLEGELKGSHLGNYIESIHYADSALGTMIDSLQANGLYEDTVIAIYGDHDGIFFRNKGEVENWLDASINKETWIKNYSPVPFVIHHPEIDAKTISAPSSQIDVSPTLLHLLGVESPLSWMGVNLLTERKKRVVIPKGDYGEQAVVEANDLRWELNEQEQQTLNIAEQLIRSNYFNMVSD